MNLQGDSINYISAFLGGIALSVSPCVYPLLPITLGYIGIKATASKLKGFILSFIYVTGIAITYSILGLIASLTGKFFGKISSNPATYIFVGLMVILFGVSMLDILHISLPPLIKLSPSKKKGYLSIFFLGLTSGLVISPCVTPVLGTILLYLATKKNILYGITLLFTFAYGMGLVFIVAGTFSAILIGLPKLGKWMIYIKRVCAFIIIGMGIYFIFIAIRRL